jgi:hypothetical protein
MTSVLNGSMQQAEDPQIAQREAALAKGNRIRTARKQIKEELAAGERELAELILDPPDAILTAKVGDVLEWMPGIGYWRAGKILGPGSESPGVGRAVRVGHLSERTRDRIAARLAHITGFVPAA